MTTGEKIRQQRRLKDMKQEELSKLTGVSLKTVQRWENGERSPRIEEMNRLAEVLQVPSEYLIGTDDTSIQSDKLTKSEPHTQEWNTNMAVITLKDGNRIQAPATPDGYAFLKEVFAMSLAGAAIA